MKEGRRVEKKVKGRGGKRRKEEDKTERKSHHLKDC